jgi:hypothetical protein
MLCLPTMPSEQVGQRARRLVVAGYDDQCPPTEKFTFVPMFSVTSLLWINSYKNLGRAENLTGNRGRPWPGALVERK